MAQELTIDQKMERFKKRKTPLPDIEKYNKEFDPKKHKVCVDKLNYPDKEIEETVIDENGKESTKKRMVPVIRSGLAYQKKVTFIATSFLFGNEVQYTNNIEDTTLFDVHGKVITKNDVKFVDREISDSVGRWTECAELWYAVPGDNDDYGFNSMFKLKVKLLTPEEYKLYPVFDLNANLASFGREFTIKNDDQEIQIFEVYTDSEIITFRNEGNGWTEERAVNPIGKIPIVYYYNKEVEWEDVQSTIEALEDSCYDIRVSNKNFNSPILTLEGEVTGSFVKNNGGKVLQMSEGAKAAFVAPPQANENQSSEIENLKNNIHSFTYTPDFSFDNVISMANVIASGNADTVFVEPHLKVMRKTTLYVPALRRRASIIKEFLQAFNVKFRNLKLDVTANIRPYVVKNEMEFYTKLMELSGNNQLYSSKYAREKAGIKDPDKMAAQIKEEQEQRAATEML
ncbi:phage portal protein [Elizabethkingia miricola]|uniref:Phage portal protein n=1 Tax=Elizabethkingia miricola TaxID=172045 RepID=A0ABD5B4R8_ELIMR|nr:phage portal protein [Elizabethkingia miricola]MDQ8748381.1 phage portal protein [Elizabethkingia miricola]